MAKVKVNKRKKSKGFTLIELLVVVAIVGILAAIAIPQFAAYRARGFNARVAADARNAATAEEAFFVDNNAYYTGGDCATGLAAFGFNGSDLVTCAASANGADGFKVATAHPSDAYATGCTWTSNPAGGAANLICN